MKASQYIAIREDERRATIDSLLLEIQDLEQQLTKLAVAYQKLMNDKKEVHHKAGFQSEGGNDERG